MKVAIITHHFPPTYNAGAEQYAYRVAKMLVNLGHQVEVVCIESISQGDLVPQCKSGIYDDILVHRLYFNLGLSSDSFELLFRNPYLGSWVRDYLRQTSPDIVHFNSGYLIGGSVIEAAHDLNIPSVLTLHEYWFLCQNHTLIRPDERICEEECSAARCAWCRLSEQRRYRIPDQIFKGKLGDFFERMSRWNWFLKLSRMEPLIRTIEDRRAYLKSVFEKVNIVISPSKFLIQKFRDFGFDANRIIYLPFGLDTRNLHPGASQLASDELRIGYLGQFAHHKGVHILLQAFKLLEPGKYKLYLYGKLSGDTPYGADILKAIEGREDIVYAGYYNNTKVGEVLNELDLIVVPSIWFENRPTIIVEALATKTPVVASRIGGIVELIESEKNGLLFEPGNMNELRGSLQRFMDDPNLLSRLREGIQPVVSAEEEIRELSTLYGRLLST